MHLVPKIRLLDSGIFEYQAVFVLLVQHYMELVGFSGIYVNFYEIDTINCTCVLSLLCNIYVKKGTGTNEDF